VSDLPRRVRRAFRDADAFEPTPDGAYRQTTTAFDATVDPGVADGATTFDVRVAVPTLPAAVEGEVAPVVADGWFETFTLRVEDVGGITRGDAALDPTVERRGEEAVAAVSFADVDPVRGVADAKAFVDFVEGTYVQGVIPGYDYVEPVAGLVATARRAGGSG
jgi:hypothetical protein